MRSAAQSRNAVHPLQSALQAFLDEARGSGSGTVTAGLRRVEDIVPVIESAVRSGDQSHITEVTREFGLELTSFVAFAQSVAYMHENTASLTPTCSGCGAVAVGLRKCSACKRAQYVSAAACCLRGC